MRMFASVSRALLVLTFLMPGMAATTHAQSKVGVEIDEVADNRMSSEFMQGFLEVNLKLKGEGLDRVNAARILIKDARDDKGTKLLDPEAKVPDFQSRDTNMGRLDVRVKNPPRQAKSVQLSGTIELFVPGRDPNAIVKIDRALSKPDKPLVSKSLKAEKIEVTLLSPAGYKAEREKNKLDEKAIDEARAEGKRRGVSEKEMEAMIELIKALDELGNEAPKPGTVILSGSEDDMDRIQKVRILRPDGQEVRVSSSGSSTRGDHTMMTLHPDEVPPSDSSLEFTLLTSKAKMSVPFELKTVTLP